jgi:DivIVA domain-containing protein
MPLTPADVHNVAFKKPPIGKRGYDEDEVDAFLDLVEAELARLIEENNDLKAQVDEMQSKPGGPPVQAIHTAPPLPPPVAVAAVPPPPVMASQQEAPAPDHGQAVKMLALAQETAEKYVADAKTEADRLVAEARGKSEQLVSESRAKADALMADARTRSESMERDARTKAQSLVTDAERKHSELVAGLEQKKGVLEKRIEELRTFEREYRIRLKSYLETQLRDLDSRASAEPAQGPQGGPPAPTGGGPVAPAYSSAYSRAGQESTR